MNRPTVLMPHAMSSVPVEDFADAVDLVRLAGSLSPAEDLRRVAPTVRAIITGNNPLKITADYMRQFPRLELVANFGVGYDKIDAVWAGTHAITVTNTPGVLDEEVADTAMALVLATVRQLPAAERHLRAGRWPEGAFPLSSSLRGRTMGILGLGRIGRAIARRAAGFGLTIIYHGRRPQPGAPYLYVPTLLGLAEAADILVIATPGGAATRALVGGPVFDALGPDGILINIARGSVVDEGALIAALRAGTIQAAGLDVFADEPRVPRELIEMDHVVLLPHVGSASHATRDAMGRLVVDNVLSWAAGKGPLTPVAETPWPGVKHGRGAR